MKWLIITSTLLVISCAESPRVTRQLPERDSYQGSAEKFADYWYSGKAELASYELAQSRYGENRIGSSVLIFVTEPFSGEKQVKLDDPNSSDAVTVMKMNFTRKFQTGIYPYSMMQSSFTPVDDYHFPYTLKSTTTSQEWCGHTFSQYNWNKNSYRLQGYSYFESEGDYRKEVKVDFLEDELWNRVRIDPDKLPVGEFLLAPGSFFKRLGHSGEVGVKATLEIEKGDDTSDYIVSYEMGRKLIITFENEFPHKILGWSEYSGDELLSSGKLKKVLHTDYWKKNASEYEYLYDSLMAN